MTAEIIGWTIAGIGILTIATVVFLIIGNEVRIKKHKGGDAKANRKQDAI